MESRINKYNQESNFSRVSRHTKLYEEINENVLDNFDVNSNATIIGEQKREIDIEQIKKILDKRYNEGPKRRSIRIEKENEESKIKEEDTKEYDLTKVLKKAHDENNETYEDARNKKLRNTQYDILNNLNVKKEEEEKEEKKYNPEENLMNLINTITINEAKNVDPLDILTDLKGDDNTQVYESIETVTKTIKEVKEENDKDLDDSFYEDNTFRKKDFEEDNEDFLEEDKLNTGIKILIFLVIVLIIVGIFLFLKSFLKF